MNDFIEREISDIGHLNIMIGELIVLLKENKEITSYIRKWKEICYYCKNKEMTLNEEIL